MTVEPGSPVAIWDSGLQPERTALAWRRTSLSVAAGATLMLRMSVEFFGFAGVMGALAALALALGAAVLGTRRYRRTRDSLAADELLPGQGRAAVLVTCATAMLGGMVALVSIGMLATGGR